MDRRQVTKAEARNHIWSGTGQGGGGVAQQYLGRSLGYWSSLKQKIKSDSKLKDVVSKLGESIPIDNE